VAGDFEGIITQANEYTRIHAGGLLVEILIGVLCWVAGYGHVAERGGLSKFLSILFSYHGYALMIHQYNRILARGALAYLKENAPTPEPPPLLKMFTKDHRTHYVMLTTTYTQIGPHFAKAIHAKYFTQYIICMFDLDVDDRNLTNFYETMYSRERTEMLYQTFKRLFMSLGPIETSDLPTEIRQLRQTYLDEILPPIEDGKKDQ
jgi:hypothetical protein